MGRSAITIIGTLPVAAMKLVAAGGRSASIAARIGYVSYGPDSTAFSIRLSLAGWTTDVHTAR
jgi:hypothetical protein